MANFQTNKKWLIAPAIPQEILAEFPSYHPLILQILYNRGIISPNPKSLPRPARPAGGRQAGQIPNPKIIEEFLNPRYEEGLYDPFLMEGMERACSRILGALKKKEKIAIWGDYDVDGICASALLFGVLNFLGDGEVEIYLPSRQNEGYGLNQEGIRYLAKKKIDLIITCDCGISSLEEIKLASKLGLEVIVTDHHQVPEKLPPSYAVLNPYQKGCSYPFKDLAGVGVVFKLAQGLLDRYQISPIKGQNFLKWQLDLVALGTLADIVSVLDENRLLVKYGLLVLSRLQRPGFSVLLKVCNIRPEAISSYDLSHRLAPRLNAAGRMGNPKLALDLLLAEDPGEAAKIALELDQLNLARQRLTEKILAEARQKISPVDEKTKLIMVSGKKWPLGILGLVASQLKDEYGLPVLVFNEENGFHTGSARSIDGFDITEALDSCGDLLVRFGGHSRAAGLSIPSESFEYLTSKLHHLALKQLSYEDLTPQVNIDTLLDFDKIDKDLFSTLETLEPFGLGNPKPNFLIKGLKIHKIETFGKSRHLKLILSQDGKSLSALGFGLGRYARHLKKGDVLDLVFNLDCDDFAKFEDLHLKIIDFKKVS